MLEIQKKNLETVKAEESGKMLDLLLQKIEKKHYLAELSKDIGSEKLLPFKERKLALLKSSINLEGEEKNFDEKRKKEIFKEKFVDAAEESKKLREQNMIIRYALRGEDLEKIDPKVLIERISEIRNVLEKYKIERPDQILNKDVKVIKSFAKELSEVVGIPEQNLIDEWIEIRKEEIELEKIRKLLENEEASKEIYDAVQRGEAVDFSRMYEEHKDLFEEEDLANKEILNKEKEIHEELPVQVSEYMAELSPVQKKEVVAVLKITDTSPREFESLMAFVDGKVDSATIEADENKNLSFVVPSPEGLLIPVAKVGDEIVLKDPSGDVKVKIGNKDAYRLESEVFDVRNTLKIMEERSEVLIPKNLREFIYSRSLAKFVNFISEYRVAIAGHSEGNKKFECRKIYEYLLSKPEDELRVLKRELEKSPEDNEIKEIAMREQVEIK